MLGKSRGGNLESILGKHQVGVKGAKLWRLSDKGPSPCSGN